MQFYLLEIEDYFLLLHYWQIVNLLVFFIVMPLAY